MASGLNPAQQEAVDTLKGPLLVLAGAGTGKTRVVTFRIANLIRHGTAPDRILAVTFTNKAAAEMLQRVRALLPNSSGARPVIGTFHSQCVRILRRHIRRLGYPERFAIYDRGAQEEVARKVLREIRVPTASLRPGDLLALISRWKTRGIRPGQAATVAETDSEHFAAVGYRRYQERLKLSGAVDFDDLLLCTEDLFEKYPDVLAEEAARFDHLLVDEYQDTNGSQYRIISALASPHRNLCVVGDDDQSIYGWRGAEVEHILHFTRDWPDAKIVRLEENYRSTEAILTMANRLIAFNKKRHDKVLRASRRGGQKPRIEQFRDEDAEAKSVVEDIQRWLKRGGWSPRDFAILCRTNEQPRIFETALRRAQLPYVLIGTSSFFDRREIRDTLAYLRTIVQPRDETSLLRIINTPARGISSQTVKWLLAEAVKSGTTVWDVACDRSRLRELPPRAQESVASFTSLIRHWQGEASRRPLPDWIQNLLDAIGYDGELQKTCVDVDELEARRASLEELINAAASFATRSRKYDVMAFLDEVALAGQDFDNEKEKQLKRDAVVLMTLHSAKGLEFPHVYMVGMEEGILPHKRSVDMNGEAIDEERRLCYVGVTRAQERLTLTMALTRRKWGKSRPTIPSPFLYELIGQADRIPPAPRKR